jgi:hypothetical protein
MRRALQHYGSRKEINPQDGAGFFFAYQAHPALTGKKTSQIWIYFFPGP